MNDPEKEIEQLGKDFKKTKILELLSQINAGQRSKFDRIYPNGLEDLDDSQLNHAYRLCMWAIESNSKASVGAK